MTNRDIDSLLERIALLEVDRIFLERAIKKLTKENKKLKKQVRRLKKEPDTIDWEEVEES